MKNIRRLFSSILVIIIALCIGGCVGRYKMPDFTGKSSAEVISTLEKSGLTNYKVNIQPDLFYKDDDPSNDTSEGEYDYEMFHSYGGCKAGDKVKKNKRINIQITAYKIPDTVSEVKTKFLDIYKGKENYEDLDLIDSLALPSKDKNGVFTTSGYGEVALTSNVDGDTSRFKDKGGNQFTVRYLGVNTPESTAKYEAWGKVASNYTSNCLNNAKSIILESPIAGDHDGYDRYLGYVWYQDSNDVWHLLNYELIALGYALVNTGDSTDNYSKIINVVGSIMSTTGGRVYGEKDHNFDYSKNPKEITLEELRNNFGLYYGKKVKVTGVVTEINNYSFILTDPESGYGIYYYIQSNTYDDYEYITDSNGILGKAVSVVGVCTYYGVDAGKDDTDLIEQISATEKGSPQLTDYRRGNFSPVIDSTTGNQKIYTISKTPLASGEEADANTIYPETINLLTHKLSQSDVGRYITVKDLAVDKVTSDTKAGGFTVYCHPMGSNVSITLRVDKIYTKASSPLYGLSTDQFPTGKRIKSVTGYISYYSGYQLNVCGNSYITISTGA